jgi:hypothetical protein
MIAGALSELLCGSSSAAACHEALDLRILGKLTERLNALINLRNIRSVLAWRRGSKALQCNHGDGIVALRKAIARPATPVRLSHVRGQGQSAALSVKLTFADTPRAGMVLSLPLGRRGVESDH